MLHTQTNVNIEHWRCGCPSRQGVEQVLNQAVCVMGAVVTQQLQAADVAGLEGSSCGMWVAQACASHKLAPQPRHAAELSSAGDA